MDPTILVLLTTIATAVLDAAVGRTTEIVFEKGANATVSWLTNAIRNKPELRKAVERLSKNPNDPVAKAEFEQQLSLLLDENPAQARQLSQYIHLRDYIGPMQRVTRKFDDLKLALAPLRGRFSTTEGRLHLAASLYVLADNVEQLDHTVFPSLRSLEREPARGMRASAVISMKSYAAFVLMRDRAIEEALAELPNDHLLRPFRDFFNSSTVQHLRNAIGTGSFIASQYFDLLIFFDGDWTGHADTEQFLELCNCIRWFYAAVFSIITQQGTQS